MADMTLTRYWKVRCSIPTEYRYKDTVRTLPTEHCLGVTAKTIDGAIAAVRALHPEATIWAVNHTGQIDHEAKE